MDFYEQLVMSEQAKQYMRGNSYVKLSTKNLSYEKQIRLFVNQVKKADHIIVGAASGLSTAGGADFYYEDTLSFEKYFSKFKNRYGINSVTEGLYKRYGTRNDFWGFMATFLYVNHNLKILPTYNSLKNILKNKSYFFLTTNQDIQAEKAFPINKIAEIQGSQKFFQCSQQCTDDIWDATNSVKGMYNFMKENDTTYVPDDLIPRCKHCGSEAFPWMRGWGNFLEGSKYHNEYKKISNDIEQHCFKDRILFIELGVGRTTPMFIQEPFWTLTKKISDSFYIMVNKDYALLPQDIEDKGLSIQNDINKVLTDVELELKKG